MRVRTSAMIAGALGAGLTASIVLAQQIPGSAPVRGRGPVPARARRARRRRMRWPSTAAAGTRGARYLLRNGLDYLQYQQYDRA